MYSSAQSSIGQMRGVSRTGVSRAENRAKDKGSARQCKGGQEGTVQEGQEDLLQGGLEGTAQAGLKGMHLGSTT